jgi:hypothetical protein
VFHPESEYFGSDGENTLRGVLKNEEAPFGIFDNVTVEIKWFTE